MRTVGVDMAVQPHYRSLRLRSTDLVVDELVRPLAKRGPLSVSMDKLGATAARWAFLAHQLAETGHPVDRTGAGEIAEVYPAGACAMWGLEESHSLKALRDKAPWLRFEPGAEEGYANEHAFDALICALIARAITLGLTAPPRHDDERALAAVEGWIHLPGPDTLHALAPSAA